MRRIIQNEILDNADAIQKQINQLYYHYEHQSQVCRTKDDFKEVTEAFINDLRILNNDIELAKIENKKLEA